MFQNKGTNTRETELGLIRLEDSVESRDIHQRRPLQSQDIRVMLDLNLRQSRRLYESLSSIPLLPFSEASSSDLRNSMTGPSLNRELPLAPVPHSGYANAAEYTQTSRIIAVALFPT